MSDKTLTGSIALTRLTHVKMTKKGKSGMIEGLFIPIEINLLDVAKDGNVYMPIRAIVKDEQDDNGQNGFISKTIGTDRYKAASSEQKEKWKDYKNEETKKVIPILGSLKDWSSNNSTATVSKEVFSEEDDLPF